MLDPSHSLSVYFYLFKVTESGISSFIQMSNILSSWLPHTHEEAGVVALTSDISFVHNISEGYKMEMASELAHDMFKVALCFLLSLLNRVTS